MKRRSTWTDRSGRRKRSRKQIVRVPRRTFRVTNQRNYVMGTKRLVTMRYCDIFTLDGGAAGAPDSRFFRANSVYDPDATGTGHQALGFDQLSPLYDHFVVVGSKIRVTLVNENSTSVGIVLVARDTNSWSGTHIRELSEQGGSIFRDAAPKGSGADRVVVEAKMNPAKFLGRSHPLSDPDLKGSSGGNPAEQAFWQITAQAMDLSTDLSGIKCFVELTYQVVWIEPKRLTES